MKGLAKTICCLAIASSAVKYAIAQSSVQERYFKNSWARVSGFTTNAPISPQAIPIGGSPSFETQYAKPTHISITLAAYETYASHFDGTEFAHYLPEIIAGSYEEDLPHKNPFNQLIPELRHFWDCRKGSEKGLAGYDSAVDRAYKYFSGGYGVNGDYDPRWGKNGIRGQGIIFLYKAGHKAKAYYYLGHAAHLLEDLTVPAHALLWPHLHWVPGSDAYETYMGSHYQRYVNPSTKPIESFDSLYDLFYKTDVITQRFDAGFGPGALGGVDGTIDKGRRRKEGFTFKNMDGEAKILAPLAISRVTALFLFFNNNVRGSPSLKAS